MEETYPVKQIDSVWLEMEVEVGAFSVNCPRIAYSGAR
jgi:hypothetical protein